MAVKVSGPDGDDDGIRLCANPACPCHIAPPLDMVESVKQGIEAGKNLVESLQKHSSEDERKMYLGGFTLYGRRILYVKATQEGMTIEGLMCERCVKELL